MPRLDRPGASIHYTKEGRGPAVLLLQGAGVVGEGWRPQIRSLADRFTLITVDNRGIGRSDLRGGPITIEAMAGDALGILDAEGIERAHVAGHSMGGLIAQQLALTAGTRLASLALLCTFAHGPEGSRISVSMLLTAIRMRVGTRQMRRNAFLELVMPASYLAAKDRRQLSAELAPLFGRDLAYQPAVMMKQVRAMSRYDAAPRFAELAHVPTLVVSATEDRIARPACGRALASAIPGARFVEIAGAAHGVTIQKADEINALLAEHWERSGRTPAPGRRLTSRWQDLPS